MRRVLALLLRGLVAVARVLASAEDHAWSRPLWKAMEFMPVQVPFVALATAVDPRLTRWGRWRRRVTPRQFLVSVTIRTALDWVFRTIVLVPLLRGLRARGLPRDAPHDPEVAIKEHV